MLSSMTPTRSHYSFLGWCSVVPTSSNGTDACPGTTYQPNGIYGIDQTTENVTTLYAMWKIDTFTVTFSAGTGGSVNRTSQASVPYGTAVTTSTNTVSINGTTTTATASTGYSFSSWTNNCGATVTAACTITANFTKNNYTITFTSGTGGSVNRTTQSVPYGTAITVSGNSVTTNGVTTTATASSGYNFKSWTNGCGSTMPASNCTITATWNEVEPMQTYTASQCQANASSQAITLEDSRDGKLYRIRYINGICTMVDNLNFNMTSGMTLSPDATNVKSTKTIATVGTLTSGNSYDEPRILVSSIISFGTTYYNYCAATAGEICVGSSTAEATEDVCPAGWRLPTGNNGGEQFILNNSTWQSNNANYPNEFNPVTVGYYLDGSLYNYTRRTYWWSSTALSAAPNSAINRYTLYYYDHDSSSLYSGDSHHRYQGLSVRCVLK